MEESHGNIAGAAKGSVHFSKQTTITHQLTNKKKKPAQRTDLNILGTMRSLTEHQLTDPSRDFANAR